VLPTGSALDGRLRFEDFNSNQVQQFHLSDLPKVAANEADKKNGPPVLTEIAENLTKALSDYDPKMSNYAFVVVKGSVDYTPERGRVTFSLKLSPKPVPVELLAKK
jgi:hypothetical protein